MKKYLGYQKSQIKRFATETGTSIEEDIRKAIADKTPIEATVTPIYTEKKDGILPEFDIRTDRQEVALDATDKFAASERMKTTDFPEPIKEQGAEGKEPIEVV